MSSENPLGEQHLQCLNSVLEACPAALAHADKCAQCGFDVTQFKDRLLQQQSMANRIKATFFPMQP